VAGGGKEIIKIKNKKNKVKKKEAMSALFFPTMASGHIIIQFNSYIEI
jgi:hypothetical protein